MKLITLNINNSMQEQLSANVNSKKSFQFYQKHIEKCEVLKKLKILCLVKLICYKKAKVVNNFRLLTNILKITLHTLSKS